MLDGDNPLQIIQDIFDVYGPKNGWPEDELGQVITDVVFCEWRDYDPDNPKPQSEQKGYWLVRFRVTSQVASHIRIKQKGKISLAAFPFTVYHDKRPWLGDRKARLVHESAPADPSAEEPLEGQ